MYHCGLDLTLGLSELSIASVEFPWGYYCGLDLTLGCSTLGSI